MFTSITCPRLFVRFLHYSYFFPPLTLLWKQVTSTVYTGLNTLVSLEISLILLGLFCRFFEIFYIIMSYANRDSFISSFLIYIPPISCWLFFTLRVYSCYLQEVWFIRSLHWWEPEIPKEALLKWGKSIVTLKCTFTLSFHFDQLNLCRV